MAACASFMGIVFFSSGNSFVHSFTDKPIPIPPGLEATGIGPKHRSWVEEETNYLLIFVFAPTCQQYDNSDAREYGYKNYYNHGQEIPQVIRQPPRNEYAAPAPVISRDYSHGRESIPVTNNEISDLRQEIQGLKQIILQNNEPSYSSNIPRNNRYY